MESPPFESANVAHVRVPPTSAFERVLTFSHGNLDD